MTENDFTRICKPRDLLKRPAAFKGTGAGRSGRRPDGRERWPRSAASARRREPWHGSGGERCGRVAVGAARGFQRWRRTYDRAAAAPARSVCRGQRAARSAGRRIAACVRSAAPRCTASCGGGGRGFAVRRRLSRGARTRVCARARACRGGSGPERGGAVARHGSPRRHRRGLCVGACGAVGRAMGAVSHRAATGQIEHVSDVQDAFLPSGQRQRQRLRCIGFERSLAARATPCRYAGRWRPRPVSVQCVVVARSAVCGGGADAPAAPGARGATWAATSGTTTSRWGRSWRP